MDFIFASDREVFQELGRRIRYARLELNISQLELAKRAGLAIGVIQKFEAGRGSSLKSFIKILRVTHNLSNLALLVPESIPSPIEIAKMSGKQRQRAGSSKIHKNKL